MIKQPKTLLGILCLFLLIHPPRTVRQFSHSLHSMPLIRAYRLLTSALIPHFLKTVIRTDLAEIPVFVPYHLQNAKLHYRKIAINIVGLPAIAITCPPGF